MSKNKKQKRLKTIIIICIILIVVLLIAIISLIPKNEEETVHINEVLTEEQKVVTEKNIARTLPEKQRIEYYIGLYIKNIENKNYDKNYEVLADKFKQNYFPTYEKYLEYVKKTYSELMKVQYNDVQRQGSYYIFDVTITNLDMFEYEINQKFIIYEDALMNYKLSFQVK